jgi:hypothetical protein
MEATKMQKRPDTNHVAIRKARPEEIKVKVGPMSKAELWARHADYHQVTVGKFGVVK